MTDHTLLLLSPLLLTSFFVFLHLPSFFLTQKKLRTAECFGIQHIYMVLPVETKNRNLGDKITKGTQHFLTIKEFRTTK